MFAESFFELSCKYGRSSTLEGIAWWLQNQTLFSVSPIKESEIDYFKSSTLLHMMVFSLFYDGKQNVYLVLSALYPSLPVLRL